MYSRQCRPHMDHNEYEENGGVAAFGRRLLIFWILGMVHLWLDRLYCRLYMAFVQLMYGPIYIRVCGLYMIYIWTI